MAGTRVGASAASASATALMLPVVFDLLYKDEQEYAEHKDGANDGCQVFRKKCEHRTPSYSPAVRTTPLEGSTA